jgi:hypothetical protein
MISQGATDQEAQLMIKTHSLKKTKGIENKIGNTKAKP